MRKYLLSTSLVALLASAAPSFAASTVGGITQHVMSFCASGCDSSSTTWVVPAGAYDVTDTYAGSGGAGGGGFNSASSGAGGGGGSGLVIRNWSLDVVPGVTVNLTFAAGPAGGAINTDGLSGTASYASWTVGALSISTPAAYGGTGGSKGTATNGGNSGAAYSSVNNVIPGSVPASTVYWANQSAATGGTGVGATAGNATTTPSDYFYGSAGAAGGGGTSGTGGYSRLVATLNSTTGEVAGGAATNTNACGGGGAGGSSMFALGGAGGSGGAGSAAAGFAAGGGGGACNAAGGAGGQGVHIIRWEQQ